MEVTRNRIATDLRDNLHIEAGDRIVAHTSLKSLGQVRGGASAVIAALVDSVGGEDRGTLMMPCFNTPAEEIDLRSTVCRLGAIPEAFRTSSNVIRSENSTHSVALLGIDSETIAATHRGKDPLGVDTPFHQIAELGGYVVHIGCDMSTCSLVHVAESIAGVPYQHIGYDGYDLPVSLVVDESRRYVCVAREKPGCSRNFTVVQDELERRGLLIRGAIGNAEALRIRGLDVLRVSLDLMEQNTGALLCDSADCYVCAGRKAHLANL